MYTIWEPIVEAKKILSPPAMCHYSLHGPAIPMSLPCYVEAYEDSVTSLTFICVFVELSLTEFNLRRQQ